MELVSNEFFWSLMGGSYFRWMEFIITRDDWVIKSIIQENPFQAMPVYFAPKPWAKSYASQI